MDYGNNLARQLLHVYVVFGIDFMSGVTAPSAAEAPGCGGHGVGEGVRRRPAKTRKFLFQHLPWAPRKGSHLWEAHRHLLCLQGSFCTITSFMHFPATVTTAVSVVGGIGESASQHQGVTLEHGVSVEQAAGAVKLSWCRSAYNSYSLCFEADETNK